jgi:hypothetical protein
MVIFPLMAHKWLKRLTRMNIIKLHNITGIDAHSHSLEINTGKQYLTSGDKMTVMAILNEDEINNRNTIIKVKGYNIDVLLIPTKFKYTFFETELGKIIQLYLTKNHKITYF